MNKIELLAPAGSFEALEAAIYNGADAVYLGGKNFGARAFANNFDHEELERAVKFAHLHDVKIYITMNTLLTEFELENAIKEVKFLYDLHVDALIIQDLGLYTRIKEEFPDFEIHASTQMHIHNVEGVKVAKEMGFHRAVLARESSIDLIKEACRQGIEIEIFIHGALCISYSGQCLMSSIAKGRSGNKGMCAQCCRLKYDIYDEENESFIDTKNQYVLSPKDNAAFKLIPELIEAGVSSLKIEGRMKKKEYVGYITRLYRQIIDAYYANKVYELSNEELKNSKVLFNREYTTTYLDGTYNAHELYHQQMPNHKGIKIGTVLDYKDGKAYVKLVEEVHQFDGIRIKGKNEHGLILNRLYLDEQLQNKGRIGEIVAFETKERVYKNDEVFKTTDSKLEAAINEYDLYRKLPIHIEIIGKINEPLKVKCRYKDVEVYVESEKLLQEAKNAPLDEERIYKQFSKLNETPYKIESIHYDLEHIFMDVKSLNEVRRLMIERLNEARVNSFKRNIELPTIEYKELQNSDAEMIIEENNSIKVDEDLYKRYPIINYDGYDLDDKKIFVSELGGILHPSTHKNAYYTLNISNSYAYEFLKKCGFKNIILSTELHLDDVKRLIDAYNERNQKDELPFVFSEGRRDVMHLRLNPLIPYNLDLKKAYSLVDQDRFYHLYMDEKGITHLLEAEKFENQDHPYHQFIRKSEID